jgi:hypothetical protein
MILPQYPPWVAPGFDGLENGEHSLGGPIMQVWDHIALHIRERFKPGRMPYDQMNVPTVMHQSALQMSAYKAGGASYQSVS